MDDNADRLISEAAQLIKNADALAIFAGAGMGVDSGLEQYRGKDGLWTKSINLNNTQVNYYDLMKPIAFREEPELAWGLIGFLLEKYENTQPHVGFSILKELIKQKEYFIVTSNIDMQFQKAGFNSKRILEYHGSIFNTQCSERIDCGIWDTPLVKFDKESIIATSLIPICPECNSFCRPNIHLFDDDFFIATIYGEQQFRFMEWEENIKRKYHNIVTLEIGAGKTISKIRRSAEEFVADDYPLIRINPDDFETNKANHISIPLGAKDSLFWIKDYIDREYCPF